MGPHGLTGFNSVRGVNIESSARLPLTIGPAISTGCCAHRRGKIKINADKSYGVISHGHLKDGMGIETQEGCVENNAVHVIFPGGCAVLATTKVEKIEDAQWKDLGMPENLWVKRVKEFEPLIISIDTKGKKLIEENKKVFNAKKGPILTKINEKIRCIK